MRRIRMPRFVPFLAMLMTAASAMAADKAVLEQKLRAKYKLSSVNAEGDFVIKGTTLVLRKGGFTGGADPLTCIHQYHDGKISLTGPSKAACTGAMRTLSKIPGISLIPGVGKTNQTAQGAVPATRPFVAGEKLYMTKIEVVKDDINLTLISEDVNQVRYRAEIRFHKAAKLEVLEAESLVAEVLGTGAGGGGGGGKSKSSQPAAAAPAEPAAEAPVAAEIPAPAPAAPVAAPPPAPADATPAPIAPPPPPTDQPAAAPPTISPGMTIDQVVGLLGQPRNIVNLGSKKIYLYPNDKVTFVDGKVTPAADSSEDQSGSTSHMLFYEIGLGVLIVGAAAFLFMRSRRPAAMAAAGSTPAVHEAAPPMNLIQRLDELEKLKERGILTPEEFEREKAKLRSM